MLPQGRRAGRAPNGVLRSPEIDQRPSTVYRKAVESLGGLQINATTKARADALSLSPPTRSSSSKRLAKSESLPVLPSRFDAKRGQFVAISPAPLLGRLAAPPPNVTLPPLKLSLKALRADRAEAQQEAKADEADEEHGEEEEEEEAQESDDEEQVAALDGFNDRHVSRSVHARALLGAIGKKRGWNAIGSSYEAAIGEVFRNRLWMKETYDPFNAVPVVKKKRRRRKHWKLEESTIWQARKLKGNSRDHYETDAALRTVFETDWQLASAGVARMVERKETWADADGNGIHDSVDAAGAVLWKHFRMVLGAFDYYAVVLETVKDADGELSVFDISYNGFQEFARDCALAEDGCSTGAIDIVWTAANALPHDALVQQLDRWNHRRLMCRHEFMQALLRLAAEMYVKPGTASSFAAATEMLCAKLLAVLPDEALQNSNVFRRKRCYIESTDMMLRRNKPTLKSIFDVYSRANRSADELQDAKLMSCGEWMVLLQHAGLLESGQVSFFGAKMIFKWSLIRACEDHTARSERKMRHLTFADFCEAIVRVACIMALPTDEEIEEAHAQDAGEYLFAMQSAADGSLEKFVRARKTGWRAAPKQHVSRCVHHLVTLLARTVKEDLADDGEHVGDAGMARPVEEEEVARFEERRRSGLTLHHVQSKAGLLDGVRASASIVRARTLEALRRVEFFSELSDAQFDALCDAMSKAPFEEDEYVFEQGEEGDSFYIITEGRAEVLRTEPGSAEEKTLCYVNEGASFGERALIKNQVRYAGIRAESKHLHTVFITRHDFERTLGAPLESLVPDQYHLDEKELVERLAGVALFANLSRDQLKLIADRCTEVKFVEKDDVIRQGDPGDAFYVITRGTADVLRWPEPLPKAEGGEGEDGDGDGVVEDPPAVQPELLASLSQWHAFGERALLKNETRYASVRVTSRELHAMSISRDVFEAALGVRLREVLQAPPTDGRAAAQPSSSSSPAAAKPAAAASKAASPAKRAVLRKQNSFAGASSYK